MLQIKTFTFNPFQENTYVLSSQSEAVIIDPGNSDKKETELLDKYIAEEKIHMKTLVSCLNSLLASGFETQFKAGKSGLKSLTTEKIYKPEQVKVLNFYRFEGESDPADNSISPAFISTFMNYYTTELKVSKDKTSQE